MVFRATRVPASAAPRAGSRDAVRYDTSAPWPDIRASFDARCYGCTWAYLGGEYRIKYTHDPFAYMCGVLWNLVRKRQEIAMEIVNGEPEGNGA